jgi:tRNA-2-methylthio-N6-dimethylallyladenosine synthase
VTRSYYVQTFGCQMNVHDSRRIEEVLRGAGYVRGEEPASAELIVINTCSVREKAEHKLMSLLGTLRPLKAARPELKLAVAGCVAQQEGETLLKKAPYVDLVIGPDNIPELPGLLRDIDAGAPPRARTVFDMESPQFLVARPVDGKEVTSFVTVMKGCDERCTFCIVPTTRGPERYRTADEIVAEVVLMAAGGVREVTLLGQTVNSWYDPSDLANKPASRMAPSKSAFADLIRRIDREAVGLERLRYTSPHPRHLTDELIAVHAELALLPSHVHLPVQSGSDTVLKRMSRRYTAAHYIERVKKLKEACPGLTLSTDLIVGFPGETDEDFEATLQLVRDANFTAAFCFKYSPRPGTPAEKMGDDVPVAVKKERLQRLFDVVGEQQSKHLQSLVGEQVQVLIEGPNDASVNRFTGRSERHEIVHVEAPEGVDPTGQVVRATVREAFNHSLLGTMEGVSLPEAPKPRARKKLNVLSA